MNESTQPFDSTQGDVEVENNQPVDDQEHIVDVERPDIAARIEKAKLLFGEFFAKYGEKMDLSDPASIQEVIEGAEEMQIFSQAEEIRNLIYDKNISIYGVCYFSNRCNQNCKFCPDRSINMRRQELQEKINNPATNPEEKTSAEVELADIDANQLKVLSPDEAKIDLRVLDGWGHREVCILSGEILGDNESAQYNLDTLVKYIQLAVDLPHVREVIVNMGGFRKSTFDYIIREIENPRGVKIQHRVFQETYDLEAYSDMTEEAPNGPYDPDTKKNYLQRYESQAAALQAGFDEVGIGALIGLTNNPLKEVFMLARHAEYIKKEGGKYPFRCCLPFGNKPEGIDVRIDYPVTTKDVSSPEKRAENQKIIELVYALARLAMPTVSIVCSERDEPDTLKILDKYANHTTLFVQPAPEQNTLMNKYLTGEITSDELLKRVPQADVTSRQFKSTILDWLSRGYHILDFDWKKYLTPEEISQYENQENS